MPELADKGSLHPSPHPSVGDTEINEDGCWTVPWVSPGLCGLVAVKAPGLRSE